LLQLDVKSLSAASLCGQFVVMAILFYSTHWYSFVTVVCTVNRAAK